VLKWVVDRVNGTGKAVDTPIGRLPAPGALDLSNIYLAPEALNELLKVDIDAWLAEIPLIKKHFSQFGDRLPGALQTEVEKLEERLIAAKK